MLEAALRADAPVQDFSEVLHGRRSVRQYFPDPVPRRTLEALIQAATLAPSAMNEQPWHFTVVTDKAVLDSISQNAKAHMLARGRAMPGHMRSMLQDGSFNIFYRAPALVVISAPEATAWKTEDCALAAQNLMLAAYARGYGTCWIGFAQEWLNTKQGAAAIDLPSGMRAVAPIIVGRPKAFPDPVARRAPAIRWIG